jgi:hypothetical protein
MNNIYSLLRVLTKSVRMQNLFVACKEINGIKLFKNSTDLSNLQTIFLSWLYSYDSINRDIILEKISEHVTDNEIYTDSYLLWRRKNSKKTNRKDNKQNDLNLVTGKHIKFPKKD